MLCKNISYVDLHTHTTFSDGGLSPGQLLQLAAKVGVKTLAITDHNIINGYLDAVKFNSLLGMTLIPGVEFDTKTEDKVKLHIIGYFPDPTNHRLRELLQEYVVANEIILPKFIKKISEHKSDLALEESDFINYRQEVPITRWIVSKILHQKGLTNDPWEAAETFLNRDQDKIKKWKLPVDHVLSAISDAGGISVLAHPGLIKLKHKQNFEELIKQLVKYGLNGLELFHFGNYTDESRLDTAVLIKAIKKYSLLPTGGTDFHLRTTPDNLTPEECYQQYVEHLDQERLQGSADELIKLLQI